MIKDHGPKNPPTGCNLGPKFPPHVGRSPKKLTAVPSIYKEVHEQRYNVFSLYIRTSAGYSLESVQDGSFRFGIQTKTQLGLNHRYWNLESSRTIFWEVILGQNCNILERKSTFRFDILNFWAIDTPMESKIG